MRPFLLLLALLAIAGCGQPPGTTVTCQIDFGDQPADPEIGQKAVAPLERRLYSGGFRRPKVQFTPPDQFTVTVFGADQQTVSRLEQFLTRSGTLEFRILANNRDHKALIERAKKESSQELRDDQGNLLAWWVPVAIGREAGFDSYTEIATRSRDVDHRTTLEILVVKDPFDIDGRYIMVATSDIDQYGFPKVDLTLERNGGKLLARLTANNLPDEAGNFSRQLGIILDGSLYMAPSIRSEIQERVEITGDFTKSEVEDLIAILNAGELPVKLKRVVLKPPAESR